MTQTELANMLGVTRQAISKMEQTEKLNDERLKEIASALGVTVEGLKKYNEETVLYNTNNFYENCGVKTNAVDNGNYHTFNNFPIDEIIEFYEKQLEKEKEKFESLKKEKE
jgi:transcriptional regulator with XRE-family HTH domain